MVSSLVAMPPSAGNSRGNDRRMALFIPPGPARSAPLRSALVAALVGLGTCSAAIASAAPTQTAEPAAKPPPTPESKKAAGLAFEKGNKAYQQGDFTGAAQAFEEAYGHVPHPDVLWNAARAWQRAGDLPRAATLYAIYLKDAPPDARDRKSAAKDLEKLASKLGRLDLYAPDAEQVEIDDRPVMGQSAYVNPGSHVVRGRLKNGKVLTRTQAVERGDVASVALIDESGDREPAAKPSSGDAGKSTTAAADIGMSVGSKAPDAASTPFKKPLPPTAVFAGAGLTALGLGLSIWSGVDTLGALDTYNANRTVENYDSGLGKQTRTNVFIGVTVGIAAVTGAAAIWLVDWSSMKGGVKAGVGLGAARIEGSF